MALPVFRPTVKRKDMGSVLSCIVSDKIGPGEISRELVARACHLLGHAGGVTLRNSYLALSVALEALGLGASDPVILPALSPSLWLRVLLDKGMVPLVADVDPESGAIDLQQVAALVQKGAKAILVPHTLGVMVDIEGLRAHGIPVLEDASQALGGKIGELPCGGAADICLVSLDPEDIVTCGGGALVLARQKSAAAALRKTQEGSPLHSQLMDMNAALGISQLAALESFVAARREIALVYGQSLLRSRHTSLVQKTDAENVLSSFPVALADGMKEVRQYALKKNVDTVPAFADTIAALEDSPAAHCVNARSLVLRCLLFPLYPMLGKRDVEAVCKVLATLP
jgi:dTDP-4-amino-4,6-dideoxygalactose transaminase